MAQLGGLGITKVSDVIRGGEDGCGGGRNTGSSLGRQTSGDVGPKVELIMIQGIIQTPFFSQASLYQTLDTCSVSDGAQIACFCSII